MKAVVVLGMHRSGTSAVAGALAAMGLFPGDAGDLMAANEDNERGYFEHLGVVACNDAVLAARAGGLFREALAAGAVGDPAVLDGLAWIVAAWAPPSPDPQLPAGLAGGIRETVSRMDRGADPAAVWMLKDPRFCLTLRHWRPFVDVAAAVVVVRSPAEVAHSLLRRDGILSSLSHDLWASYVGGALGEASDLPTLIVDYGQLLRSPDEGLAGIARFLGDRGVPLPAGRLAEGVAFLSPGLRHLAGEAIGVPGPLAEAYEALRSAHLTKAGGGALPRIPPPPDPGGWEKALHLAVRQERAAAVERLEREKAAIRREKDLLAERLHGLNLNRVTGPAIRTLRRLRKDPSIGDWRIGGGA